MFRSDLGSEFINEPTRKFLEQHGIRFEQACAGDHYQNGLAEVFIHILYDMARTMLTDAKLLAYLWGEASGVCQELPTDFVEPARAVVSVRNVIRPKIRRQTFSSLWRQVYCDDAPR